jgi:hypothetical protein
MSVKLERVKLVYSIDEDKEINFTSIEKGIESLLQLIEDHPKQITYFSLTAEYTKIIKTNDRIRLSPFSMAIILVQ